MAERGHNLAEARAERVKRDVERAAALVPQLAKENISTGKFDEAWLVAQLVEFSFTRSGDVLVKIRVPYIYRDQAKNLADAYGVMMQVHMERWSQADEARRQANE